MSHAASPDEGRTAGGRRAHDRDGEAAAKVVVMELATAGGPLSAEELGRRTLLSTETVSAALAALQSMGFCRELSGDERRPARYVAADPQSAD